MKRSIMLVISLIVVLTVVVSTSAAETVLTEDFTASALDVHMIRFRDIAHATLSYKGVTGAENFTVRFGKKVRNANDSDADDILSRISLEMNNKDGVFEVVMIHPGEKTTGVIKRVLDHNEWSVTIEVSGPRNVDTDVDADFSDVKTIDTNGSMTINADFGDTVVKNHVGGVDVSTEFGSLRIENLDGSFKIDGSLSDINVAMSRIGGNCIGSTSFAHFDLSVTKDADAEIVTNTSFGKAKFYLGSVNNDNHRPGKFVIGDGGPIIDLSTEFGDIIIRDNADVTVAAAAAESPVTGVIPLYSDTWWRLKGDNGTITVTAEKYRNDKGNSAATLSFAGDEGTLKLDVKEMKDGLYLSRIDGSFFGRELTGVSFNPPKLWLPYEENQPVDNDYILGTVKTENVGELTTPSGTNEKVIRCAISFDNDSHVVYLSPGVGFVGIDSYQLEAWDSGRKQTGYARRPPEPRFESGQITKISITGTHYLTENEIRNRIGLLEGSTYTRAQIDEALKKFEKSSKYISRAHYNIDTNGNMSIRISENKVHTRNVEAVASFNSIGGVGLGPEVSIKSLVGPVSLLKGSAQYHFANSEWTYKALAEKSFFDRNKLSFGGTYRQDYESAMGWAIPDNEMYLNAFLLGLETNHWYQVEGSTGYVSFSLGKAALLKAEYFEDDYSSLKKHTNWSFFNHRHIKDDNLPLSPMDENRLAGYRIRGEFNYSPEDLDSELTLEMEKAPDSGNNAMGEYTRYFGNFVNTWRYSRDNYLKIRVAGGYSDDFLPAPRAFSLGGLNTLRGYDYQSIPDIMPFSFQYGGSSMALCNVEYLLGGTDEPGLIFFADAGNVWLKGQDAKFSDLKRDIGVSLAIGSIFDSDNSDRFFGDVQGVRVNWAVPVGNVPHVSNWTVNFCRTF